MLPLPRSRTSSFSSSFNPLIGPSDTHYRALSVPPPSSFNSNNSIGTSINGGSVGGFSTLPTRISGKITACKPCKTSGKICRSGQRPCIACLTSGQKDLCIQGMRDDYHAEKLRELSPKKSHAKPIFDDQPMFPPSSDPPQLRNRFGYKFPIHLEKPLTYPPLGSSLEHVAAPRIKTQVSMEMTNPVFMVLDFEFKIGRASRDCLPLFGSHPHEMRGQSFATHLPITERERWKSLTKLLFSQTKLPDNFLEIPPVELSRLTWDQLKAPVQGLKPAGKQLMIRHKTGETIPVQIVIWFGSCYGATASDYSSFKQAIILARITPLNAASPNATRIRPAHPSGGLLGFDGPSGNGAGTGTLPRRRNLSFTGGITLPPPLPPLYMAGEGFAPLPPLPPIGFSSALQPLPPLPSQRARRPSGSLAPLPHEGLASGSDLSLPPLSRPRSRTSSLLGQHSRSLSNGPLTTFPSSSYEKPMAIPPVPIDEFPPLPRPASRNKR